MTSIDQIMNDAVLHFGAGMFFTFADYATYRIANPKEKRLEEKKDCLRSIEILLDANAKRIPAISADGKVEEPAVAVPAGPSTDSLQYAQNIYNVKDHFIKMGLAKKDLPLYQRVKNFVRSAVYEERLNNLSPTGKLGAALVLEIGYDSILGFLHYTMIRQESPIASLANNIYQVPMFWGGLMVGNGLKKAFHWAATPGQEKAAEKAIKQLVRETNIVDLVMGYEPTEEVQGQLSEMGVGGYATQLTGAGRKLYEKLGKSVSNITGSITSYHERKNEEEKARKDALRERFKQITDRK